MKTFKLNGYTVQVFDSYNGKQMFISNGRGEQIWAHKFTGDAMTQAKRVISQQ